MKSSVSLWKCLAHELGERCSVDTIRDCDYVTERWRSEGSSVLTIALPDYGKAFERWLELGRVDASLTPSFKAKGGLPLFLGGFLACVFSTESGAVLDTPDVSAIQAVRQLCGLFGKMEEQASPARTNTAFRKYLEIDDEVQEWESRWTVEGVSPLSRVFYLLFGGVCDDVDRKVDGLALLPRHGPGSTAEGILGNQKWDFKTWHQRLEPYFPSADYLLPNPRYYTTLEAVNFVEPGAELPAKVVAVPKNAKTPRLICKEPVCMQYTQQALARPLMKAIEDHRVLKRIIRFTDQEPNQVLAREGSLMGNLATLDLSEASDRVPNVLVEQLFNKWSGLNGAIQACRSRQAVVQIGDEAIVRQLSKFASMGSALCFPVEAMVFTAIVFLGIEQAVGRRLSASDVSQLAGQVAVYGDDIIVPVDHVRSVIHALESFGLKVNSQKSFWNGKFRESCGKEYYNGFDVSIVKVRRHIPSDRRDVEGLVSLVSTFNQLNDMGLVHTTNFLRKRIVALLDGFFPKVTRSSAILGEFDDVYQDIEGLCKKRHVPVTKGYVVKSHIPVNEINDHGALLKWFLKEGEDPFEKGHLRRSGRSSSVSINLRSAPV